MLDEKSIQVYVRIVLDAIDQLLLWQPEYGGTNFNSENYCPYLMSSTVGVTLLFAQKKIIIFSPIEDDHCVRNPISSIQTEKNNHFFREIAYCFKVGEALSGMNSIYKEIDEPLYNNNFQKDAHDHDKLEKAIHTAMIEKYSLSPKNGSYHSENGIHFILPSAAQKSSSGGCYIATAVYGSYDCPQVWTLRRFRDFKLAKSFGGQVFIKVYYAISPTLVRWFGKTTWFNHLWRRRLDKMVERLHKNGYADTPYNDK